MALAALIVVAAAFLAPTEGRGDPIANRFLFYPDHYHPLAPYRVADGAREVWLTASDGVRLHAEYFPADNPEGALVYFHGNAGLLSDWSEAAAEIARRDRLSTLVFDYRGYGLSEGKPSAPGILKDGRAARDWLCAETGLQPDGLIYYGVSLGAAVAAGLAAETGARGLVLDSGFASLPAMGKVIMPWLPARWVLRYPLDSEEAVARYAGPLVVVHGTADAIIPYDQGEALYRASPSRRKTLVNLTGAGHGPHSSAAALALLEKLTTAPDPSGAEQPPTPSTRKDAP